MDIIQQLVKQNKQITMKHNSNNNMPSKQSVYNIQPWKDQPNQIPRKFLKMHNFIQKKSIDKNKYQNLPQLQIASNSVYFIKNNMEQPIIAPKLPIRSHRTTCNSPQIKHQQSQIASFKAKYYLTNHLYSEPANQNLNSCQQNPEKTIQQNNKRQIIFSLQKVNPTTNNTFMNFSKMKKKGFLSSKNLCQKGLQHSPLASFLKRIGKYYNDYPQVIDAFERRRLKTEKQNERNQFVKQILLLSNQRIQFMKGKKQKMKEQIRKKKQKYVCKEEMYKPSEVVQQKIALQLFLERKLYLLKHKSKDFEITAKRLVESMKRLNK